MSSSGRPAARLLETSFTAQQLSARRVTPFYASTAVLAGEWVTPSVDTTFGLGNSITKALDTAAFSIGVAEAAIPINTWGDVVTWGVANARVEGSVAALDVLKINTVDGEAIIVTDGDDHVVGCALEAEGAVTATFARVFVQCG